jgi:hypothetical protein
MYGRTPQDDLNAVQREAQALEMAVSGYTFDEIAKEIGYADASGAYRAYRRALGKEKEPEKQELRKEHRKLTKIYRRALAPNVKAREARSVEVLIKLMEREARLFGLDLATEAENNATPYNKRVNVHISADPAPSEQPGEAA